MRPLHPHPCAWLSVLVALSACTAPKREGHAPARSTTTQTDAAVDVSVDSGPSSLWPTRVEPLGVGQASGSHAACLARNRAALTTGVAEAIADLGYDSFFDDVCTAEDALGAREPRLCSSILASSLREGCLLRVAVRNGAPDACPSGSSGRDPMCLAFASGEIALCDAASTRDRVRCRAALEGAPERCRAASDVALCEATVARFGAVVSPRLARHRVMSSASITARAEGAAAQQTLEAPETSHGVRLVPEGCGYVITLELPTARFGTRDALISLRFVVPAREPLPIRIPAASLGLHARIDGHALDTLLGSSGTLEISRFTPRRLGEVALSFSVRVRDGDVRFAITGTLETFVRDLDEAGCSAP